MGQQVETLQDLMQPGLHTVLSVPIQRREACVLATTARTTWDGSSSRGSTRMLTIAFLASARASETDHATER